MAYLCLTRNGRNKYHARGFAKYRGISLLLAVTAIFSYLIYSQRISLIKILTMSSEDPTPNSRKESLKHFLKYNIKYFFNPSHLCRPTPDEFKITIVVISKVSNFAVRQAIRATWGNSSALQVTVVFLLGTTTKYQDMAAVAEEYRAHGDVIQANFIDSYGNLTIKSLVMLHWFHHFCGNSNFLLKCDDDIYVNVPHLLKIGDEYSLNLSRSNSGRAMLGRYIIKRIVVRDKKSKWYVSPEQFSKKQWPMYLRGPSYLMELSQAYEMVEGCLEFVNIPIEDAVLTGLCPEALHIPRKEVTGFHVLPVDMSPACLRDVITRAEVSEKAMYKLRDIELKCKLNKNMNLTKEELEEVLLLEKD